VILSIAMQIRFSTQVFLSLFVAVTVWICHEDGLLSRPEALLYRWSLGLAHLGQQPPPTRPVAVLKELLPLPIYPFTPFPVSPLP
jgi:hypothetical protein